MTTWCATWWRSSPFLCAPLRASLGAEPGAESGWLRAAGCRPLGCARRKLSVAEGRMIGDDPEGWAGSGGRKAAAA
jgi:hypothetical protein